MVEIKYQKVRPDQNGINKNRFFVKVFVSQNIHFKYEEKPSDESPKSPPTHVPQDIPTSRKHAEDGLSSRLTPFDNQAQKLLTISTFVFTNFS